MRYTLQEESFDRARFVIESALPDALATCRHRVRTLFVVQATGKSDVGRRVGHRLCQNQATTQREHDRMVLFVIVVLPQL